MNGNELEKRIAKSCSNCKQTIFQDQCCICDLYLSKIHKNCVSLSPSEIKCMPLQKRALLLVCIGCKKHLARTWDLINLFDEMKAEISDLKKEVRELKSSSQNSERLNKTYSDILKDQKDNTNRTKISSQPPTLIIKPPKDQNVEITKKEIQTRINPSDLNIGVKNMRGTKQGDIIVKCANKQDAEALKKAADNYLGKNYINEMPKRHLPKIKIVGYRGTKSSTEIEHCIRKQNKWIESEDTYKVTYIKNIKTRNYSTIFLE